MRAQLKSNAGMTSDDQALLKAYIPDDVLEKRKQEYKRLKEKVDEKIGTNIMRFYEKPMGEERKTELKDIVASKRRLFPQVELQKKYKDLDGINQEFEKRFNEYNKSF